ncbi:MAG: PQQ-binding-like beta-propeller repeat protein [Phycisphaerales bacterium]|nr:PQQ-binding-like beta-propeller repeat protein [Phycisphaerales bacterium]
MRRRLRCFSLFALLFGITGCGIAQEVTPADGARKPDDPATFRMIVMDPLSDKIACACVQGHAQRKYGDLAKFLSQRLGWPVDIAYGESLHSVLEKQPGRFDLVIGKQSVIKADAERTKTPLRPIAMLTDKTGSTDMTGMFVVRSGDKAKSIADLKGYRIVFGPREEDEKHAAALAALDKAGVPRPADLTIIGSCTPAATEVAAKDADAAVISSYAVPLLEGCKAVAKGELRVVGETAAVPFVTVFSPESATREQTAAILAALLAMKSDAKLLKLMESRDGFVAMPEKTDEKPARPAGEAKTDDKPSASADPISPKNAGWTDWRGPRRAAISGAVPARLPEKPVFLWRRSLNGGALSGVAATDRFVIVADKDASGEHDIFQCLAADTGEPIWKLEYAAAGEMDYGNGPRATPVIHDGRVYLLGAFGHLHCADLETGRVLWKRNLVRDFGAELVTWGMCSTPLIVDDRLIVNPGAPSASLVALDRRDGRVLWKTPGERSAYASFIVAKLGGVTQIVGFDAESMGGWDPATGKRLWTQTSASKEFHVPTPIVAGDRLVVAGEAAGTRLFGFDAQGRLTESPLAAQRALKPDASTPVVVGDLLFGCAGKLVCLDLRDNLRVRWEAVDDAFDDYASIIAGNGRLLITSAAGELVLVEAAGDAFKLVSRLRLFEGDADVWAHPALLPGRLYVREAREIVCLRLETPPS